MAKEKYKLGFVDVLYGVIITYGYNFFDAANSTIEFFFLAFAFLIILLDWVYVHKLYSGLEYESNFVFFMDIIILIAISQLFKSSIGISETRYNYWIWLGILFILYFVWDISLSRKRKIEYNWKFAATGDALAAIIYLSIYFLVSKLSRNYHIKELYLFILTVSIYFGAFCSWFKKNKSPIGISAKAKGK